MIETVGMVDVQHGAGIVDPQVAGALEPAAHHDEPRAHVRFVHRAMDVADHHDIDRAGERGGVLAINPQVTILVVLELALVAALKRMIQCSRDRPGYAAEAFEECVRFHPCLPATARAQAVAMNQPDPLSINGHIVGFGDDPSTELPLVERAEPTVVVAGHDGERTTPAAKPGQGAETVGFKRLVAGAASAHPEVAEIAAQDQFIVGVQSQEPVAEAAVSLGAIGPEMDVAGEVMRHVGRVSAVDQSGSASQTREAERVEELRGQAPIPRPRRDAGMISTGRAGRRLGPIHRFGYGALWRAA